MPCKIEIRKTIDKSIADKTQNDFWGFAEKQARKIVTDLNSLWGNIAKTVQTTAEGGWRILTSKIEEAVNREFDKQATAEKSFERDLDFFNGDRALYEQENKEEQRGEFFQKEGTESSTASPKTLSLIKDFIKRIGVDVKSMKQIVVNGVKQDANGAALIMQNLIQVVEGTEAVSLSEEAMHFAVEIIKQTNPSLYKTLLKEINNYALYKQVLDQYGTDPNYQGKDGKPDIQKLKEEAIAKVLTETIINKNEGSTEKPELLAKTQSL